MGRGRGNGEGDFLAVGGGGEIFSSRESERSKGRNGAEEVGVGGRDELGLDEHGFFPTSEAFLGDFDVVTAGFEVDGVVGDLVGGFTVNDDAGAGGVAGGG